MPHLLFMIRPVSTAKYIHVRAAGRLTTVWLNEYIYLQPYAGRTATGRTYGPYVRAVKYIWALGEYSYGRIIFNTVTDNLAQTTVAVDTVLRPGYGPYFTKPHDFTGPYVRAVKYIWALTSDF